MKKLRLSCLLLAGCVALSLLGGCGGADPETPPPSNPEDPTPPVSGETQEMLDTRITYDKAMGGQLEIPYRPNKSALFGLTMEEEEISGRYYYYDAAKSMLVVDESYVLALGEGEYACGIVSDDGTLAFTLNVKSSVPSRFDADRVRTYRYGGGDMTFSCSGGAAVKEVAVAGVPVAETYYAYADGVLTLRESLLKKLSGKTDLSVTMTNNVIYPVRIFSDSVFTADYDVVTVYDDTVSTSGLNSLVQDSNTMKIVEDGIDGRSLAYTPSEATYSMGDWARAFFTFKDPSYYDSSIMWAQVNFDNMGDRTYELAFDYTVRSATEEDSYTLYLMRNEEVNFFVTPQRVGINLPLDTSPGTHHFSQTFGGDLLTGFYFFADSYSEGSSLLIDNFRITEHTPAALARFESKTLDYSGSSGDALLRAELNGCTVTKILKCLGGEGNYAPVSPGLYETTEEGVVLKSALMEGLFGNCRLVLFLSDGESVIVDVESDVLFFSDYDDTTVFDGTMSEWGQNAFTNDSAILTLTESGIEGRSLLYEPGKASFKMGTWANRVLTLQDPKIFAFTWWQIDISRAKTYEISFDYRVGGSDCAFRLAVLSDANGPVYIDPASHGTVYALSETGDAHFSARVAGSAFYGMLVYAPDGYRGNATLLIDNVKVEEVQA